MFCYSKNCESTVCSIEDLFTSRAKGQHLKRVSELITNSKKEKKKSSRAYLTLALLPP